MSETKSTNDLIIQLIRDDVKIYDERLHEFCVLKLREQRDLREKKKRKDMRDKKRQEMIDAGIPVKKRGRQKKYHTEEEKKEAARIQRKKWYEKVKLQPDRISVYREKSRICMKNKRERDMVSV